MNSRRSEGEAGYAFCGRFGLKLRMQDEMLALRLLETSIGHFTALLVWVGAVCIAAAVRAASRVPHDPSQEV